MGGPQGSSSGGGKECKRSVKILSSEGEQEVKTWYACVYNSSIEGRGIPKICCQLRWSFSEGGL